MKHLRILFIGNSHTYVNGVPALVRDLAAADGYEVDVTMIAHGGWYLWQHVQEPDVPFNIKYGHYDYVVLQEHSHPFDSIVAYWQAMHTLVDWIREAGSTPVLYGTWSQKAEPFMQERMNAFNRDLVRDTGAVYAGVGESWWAYMQSRPEIDLYYEDGAHASPEGSAYAAHVIWEAIRQDAAEKPGLA